VRGKMKKTLTLILLGAATVFCTAAVAEESGVGIALRAEPGITSYGNSTSNISALGYSGNSASGMYYYDLTIGATVFFPGGLVLDGYYRQPLTKAKNQMNFAVPTPVSVELDRKEYNFTVAYPISDHVGIFTGWRNFSIKTSSAIGPFASTNAFKFESRGPTLGLSYGSVSENLKSSHNFTAGVSYQKGKYEAVLGTGNINVKAQKSGVAYSGGYQYRYAFSDQWDASIGVDAYYLKLNGLKFGTNTFSYREASISGRLGLRYTF